jgi:hypothetical protein
MACAIALHGWETCCGADKTDLQTKRIEATVNKALLRAKRPDLFLVVMTKETSYHTTASRQPGKVAGRELPLPPTRTTPGTRMSFTRGGKVLLEVVMAKPGQYLQVEECKFHVFESRQAAHDYLVEFLKKYAGQPASPRRPNPIGDFTLLGSFKTNEEAEKARDNAQTSYDAQPKLVP